MAEQDRDQERERWKRLVADFEASDLTQREFASERGIPLCQGDPLQQLA